MTLLREVKKFLKKFISNPIVLAGLAYMIYRMIKKRKKESFSSDSFKEDLKIIEEEGENEIIYDTNTKHYIWIRNDEILGNSEDLEELKGMKNENKESLNKLKEKFMKERSIDEDVGQEIDEFYVSVIKKGREILNKEFNSINDAENFAKQYMRNNKESYKERLNKFKEAYLPNGVKLKYKNDGMVYIRGPFDDEEKAIKFAKERKIKDYEIIK